MTAVRLAECRAAKRSVLRQDRGRAALAAVRPRSFCWFVREHPPLPYLLWLRSRQGLLTVTSPDEFVLRQPSRRRFGGEDPYAGLPRTVRLLTALDEAWEFVLLSAGSVAAVALGLAVLFVLRVAGVDRSVRAAFATLWEALLLLLVVVFVVATLATFAAQLLRLPARRRRLVLDRALGSAPRVALLHVPPSRDPLEVLVGGGRPSVTVVPQAACTSSAVWAALDGVRTEPVPRHPDVRIFAPSGARMPPPEPRRPRPLRALQVLVVTHLVGLAYLAFTLTQLQTPCPPAGCPEAEPRTFWPMLYWLATRLVTGGDPEGVGPSSWWLRGIGTLVSVYGVVLFVGLVSAVIQESWDEVQTDADGLGAELALAIDRRGGEPEQPTDNEPTTVARRTALQLAEGLRRWATRPRSGR